MTKYIPLATLSIKFLFSQWQEDSYAYIFIALFLLIAGYIIYGKLVEKIFVIDNDNPTAYKTNDGVDYMPMHPIKGWLIQLLNIAGLGPVFGAVAGAVYGPPALIWIVVGCILPVQSTTTSPECSA